MFRRLLLAMLLTLTGVMVATSPVAASSSAGKMLCEQLAQSHTAMHVAGGHDHHAMMAKADNGSGGEMGICCDHACLIELGHMSRNVGVSLTESRIVVAWMASDLTELAHPDGLRRPPRA